MEKYLIAAIAIYLCANVKRVERKRRVDLCVNVKVKNLMANNKKGSKGGTPGKSSRKEELCRHILQKIYGMPFVSTRKLKWLKNPETGKPLELDMFNSKLNIACEFNGIQHYKYQHGFHKNYKAFIDQKRRDQIKQKLCRDNGIILVSVPYFVEDHDLGRYMMDRINRGTLAKRLTMIGKVAK